MILFLIIKKGGDFDEKIREKIFSFATSNTNSNIIVAIPHNLTTMDAKNFMHLISDKNLIEIPSLIAGKNFSFVFGNREKLISDEEYLEEFVKKCYRIKSEFFLSYL